MAISNEEQIGVFHNLNEIKASLQKIAPFSDDYALLLDRITSLAIEFDDISGEMNRNAEKLIDDPEQLNLLSQKLQLIFSLQKKHQVATVEELLAIQTGLENAVLELGTMEEDIAIFNCFVVFLYRAIRCYGGSNS